MEPKQGAELIPLQDKVVCFQFGNRIVNGRVETVQTFGSMWCLFTDEDFDELVRLKSETDALNALIDEGREAMKGLNTPAPADGTK